MVIKSFISAFIYLLILTFATHFIRTFAFSRHEGVTFECSIITVVISYVQIIENGLSWLTLGQFLIFLFFFIFNAFSQHKYYLKLQTRIDDAFGKRAVVLSDDWKKDFITDNLKTLASVAIMPSFSRFIEESKYFNNSGNIIGLTKTIMRRSRFQKRKYLMREKFSDCINYIGPCKATVELTIDDKHNDDVSDAVLPNDLALDFKDEKWGLFDFDVSGFGAMLILFIGISLYNATPEIFPATMNFTVPLFVHIIVLVGIILLTHILRIMAFARYESLPYEIVFVSLIIASYLFFQSYKTILSNLFLASGRWAWISLGIFLLFFILFLAVSLINYSMDKKLHKRINKVFDTIITDIAYRNETFRVQRKFLEHLKYISEWAITPNYTNPTQAFLKFLTAISSLAARPLKKSKKDSGESKPKTDFGTLIGEKKDTPKLMVELILSLKPDRKGNAAADAQKEKIKSKKMEELIELLRKDYNCPFCDINTFTLSKKEAATALAATVFLGVFGLILLLGIYILKINFNLPIL